MTAVDDFLGELEASLHVGGRSRRRLVAECRDHLADSSADCGPEEAVRRFGSAADLVRSYEIEVSIRRVLRATAAAVAGVLGIGASALVMVNAADAHASAPVGWAVVFFGAAQVSAASLLLAVLRAAVMRAGTGTPGDVLLLCRRGGLALGFAFVTLFAVGAGVPGHTAAWAVLAGPVVAVIAAGCIARARWLARQLDRDASQLARAPQADVAALAGRWVDTRGSAWHAHPGAVLAPTVVVTMLGAFGWALLDHGTVAGSVEGAGVEAALTIAGFVLLGRILGLYPALGRRR